MLIDREMVRNVFETTVAGSRHLISVSAIAQVALTGILRAAQVFRPRISRVGRWHHLWRWPLRVAVCFSVMAGGPLGGKAFSATLRERHDLMGSYQPGATLATVLHHGPEQWKTADPVALPIATDAVGGTTGRS